MAMRLGSIIEHMKACIRLLHTPLIFTQIMRHEGDAEQQRAQKRGRKTDEAKRYLSIRQMADPHRNGGEGTHLNSVMLIAPAKSPSALPSFG